ncbi:hypothetical protein M422DRAFT_50690 [Sphaerobolus stellatus SS14]|uniref:Uncharacterized protein n=1 Tax=Sphaerobolus stellatus (strain SS14) TaxID=990650 RepID=A0A0C9VIE7_SPHS4|nr:hypothetical protein M422DRAFT_50690 [Sphaerobolus stellatus SS14]
MMQKTIHLRESLALAEDSEMIPNKIFTYLTFPCGPPFSPAHDPHQDLYVLNPNFKPSSGKEEEKEDQKHESYHPKLLRKHAILKRSFAVFPPVTGMYLDWGYGDWDLYDTVGEIETGTGLVGGSSMKAVTVWDIWAEMIPILDKPFVPGEYINIAQHPAGMWKTIIEVNTQDIEGTVGNAEMMAHILSRFPTRRALFSVCHWDGLELREIVETELGWLAAFSVQFKTYDSPAVLPRHWWRVFDKQE